MMRIMLRNLRSHKMRAVLTTLAILLGVAMISGTYVLTDQINNGFTNIFKQSAKGSDVSITRKAAFTGSPYGSSGAIDTSMLRTVKSVAGVGQAVGFVYGSGYAVVNGKVVSTGGAPGLVSTS